MSELPTPAGLGGKKLPSEDGMKVNAISFKEREFPPHIVEYGKKGNSLIFHVFKDGVYPMSFRSRLYGALLKNFGFNGKEHKLLMIDWVEEFNSWCIIIKNVLELSPPPSDEDIENFLDSVFS